MKERTIIITDFETTGWGDDTDKSFNNPLNNESGQVYSWFIKVIQKTKLGWKALQTFDKYGIDPNDWLNQVNKVSVALNEDVAIIFHNGGNFDLHFVEGILFNNGYKERLLWEDGADIDIVSGSTFKKSLTQFNLPRNTKEEAKGLKEYGQILANNKRKYIFQWTSGLPTMVSRNRKKVFINRTINAYDTKAIFNTSLKGMGIIVAAAKTGKKTKDLTDEDMKKWGKLDNAIDYNRSTLYKSIEELENDGVELEYLERDVDVLVNAVQLFDEKFPIEKWSYTAGSNAFKLWQQKQLEAIEVGELEMEIKEKGKVIYKFNNKWMTEHGVKKTMFYQDFGSNWINKNQYINLEKYFKGGITTVNPQYQGLPLKDIVVADINSSYPNQMYSEKMFPIGEPYHTITTDNNFKSVKSYGEAPEGEGYDFHFYKLITYGDFVNEGGLPFLTNKHDWNKGLETRDKVLKPGVFWIPQPIYDAFLKYYKPVNDAHFDAVIEYSFKQAKGNDIFKSVEYLYSLKQEASNEGNEPLRHSAKITLNSTFGKMSQKFVAETGIWDTTKSSPEWNRSSEWSPKGYYPLGIVIAAYGRLQLVDAIKDNYEVVAYIDTDSLFLNTRHPKYHELYDNLDKGDNLGQWELEFFFKEFTPFVSKRYFGKGWKISDEKVLKDKPLKIKSALAGVRVDSIRNEEVLANINGDFKDWWTMFNNGFTADNQLRPTKGFGWIVLHPIDITLGSIFDPTNAISTDSWYSFENGKELKQKSERVKSFDSKIKEQLKKLNQLT